MQALARTARATGLFYLGLGIAGMLGFLLIRPRLFAAGDPATTYANLVQHESLARACRRTGFGGRSSRLRPFRAVAIVVLIAALAILSLTHASLVRAAVRAGACVQLTLFQRLR